MFLTIIVIKRFLSDGLIVNRFLIVGLIDKIIIYY